MSKFIHYRSDIDGLRAVAILAVVLFHLNPSYLHGGFIGVDIFFVISGFLITKIIIRELESNAFDLTQFYVRRIRRILPLLFTVLATSLIFACFILTADDMVWFAKTLQYSALQISNILFQQEVGYFDPKFDSMPLLHTWSLAVEEQFYLILPITLVILFKFKRHQNLPYYTLLVLTLISLIASQYLLSNQPRVAFYSLPSRFWELGIGGLLAFNKIQQPSKLMNEALGVVGLFIIITSFIFMQDTNFPGIKALAPCFGAAIIIFSGQKYQTKIHNLLSNKYLVFIGLISYSLYLWHWPIIAFYKYVTGDVVFTYMTSILIFSVSVILSYLSWKFIEVPFRKKKSLKDESYSDDVLNNSGNAKSYFNQGATSNMTPIISTVVCIVVFYWAGSQVISNQGWEWRLIDAESVVYANAKELNTLSPIQKLTDVEWCHIFREETYDEGKRLPVDYRKCVIGDNKNFEVLLIGDSHAAHYSTAVFDWANGKGLSVLMLTAGACSSFGVYTGSREKYCNDYAARVESVLNSHTEDIKYIFLAQKWMDDLYVRNKDSILNLKKMFSVDAKVIILGQVPSMSLKGYDLKRPLIHNNFISGERRANIKNANNFISKLTTEFDNVIFFDPAQFFCKNDNCSAVYQNNLLYADDTHLNTFGSKYIAKYFNFR